MPPPPLYHTARFLGVRLFRVQIANRHIRIPACKGGRFGAPDADWLEMPKAEPRPLTGVRLRP